MNYRISLPQQGFSVSKIGSTMPKRLHAPKTCRIYASASEAYNKKSVAAPTNNRVVYGRVVENKNGGSVIQLIDDETQRGFMPLKEYPINMDRKVRKKDEDGIPLGLVRAFSVLDHAPEGINATSSDLFLSARAIDFNVLWQRLTQMSEISTVSRENFSVVINGVNSGGLTAHLCSLPVFIPVSQLERKNDGSWWTEEEMRSFFVGQHMTVTILEVSPSEKKVVCSALKAKENDKLRKIEVGSVVKGTVRRIEPFGVFVGISETKISGLLHISNISRNHVGQANSVFDIGEEISCIVMGLDENYANLSLSTAELEPEDGDILKDKASVWAQAEEQGLIFRKFLEESMHEAF